MVSEIVGRDRSPKVTALMIGCWSRDIWTSALSEIGQGELMGTIRCTQIPFILIAISQSHLSPLSKSYSSNPLLDPKTHFDTGIVELFVLSCFSRPPMLINPCSMFSPSFLLLMPRSRLIASSFRDYDYSAYCQPHSGSAAYTFPIVIYS